MTAIPFLVLTLASAGAAPQGVLIDFMSQNCGPCREMSSIISQLHQQGYPVRKVDIDQDPEMAQRFHITNIPAFVLVVNGREVNRIIGLTTEGQLKRMLAQIPTEPAETVETPDTSTSNRAAKPKPAPPKKISAIDIDDRPKRSGIASLLPGKSNKDNVVIVEPASARAAVRENNANPQSEFEQPTNSAATASSVRIRVKDASGTNFGSGTVIASKAGRAYVLACGHIFRDVDKAVSLEVDVFSGNKVQMYPGTVIRYDLTAEVGVVSIEPENVIPVSKIASLEQAPAKGDHVFSIGCGGGSPPSAERLEIKGLNLYRGPDTIECTGEPALGRSGGGLFNKDGQVIGVCYGAHDNRGIYAGLKPILQLLDEAKLSSIYREEPTVPANAQLAFDDNQTDRSAADIQKTTRRAENTVDESVSARLAADARAAEIQTASENADEAEVVCIIRPLNDPQAASRVVIINRASSRFVNYLKGEMSNQPRQTMAHQPAKDAEPKSKPSAREQAATADQPRVSDELNPAGSPLNVETRQANRPTVTAELREDAGPRAYRRSAASR